MSFALMLLVALAPAASALAWRGELRAHDGLDVTGHATFATRNGALDLAPAVRADEVLSLRWASVEGTLVAHERRYAGGGDVELATGADSPSTERIVGGAGGLRDLRCAPGCIALLVAEGAGTLGLEGNASGRAVPTTEPRTYAWNGVANNAANYAFTIEKGWIEASAGPGEMLRDAAPSARGDLTLFLANVTATMRDGANERALDTTNRSEPQTGPLGVPIGRTVVSSFLVLHVHDAMLDAAPDSRAVFAAPRPDLALEGALDARAARGTLEANGARFDLRGDDVLIVGAASLALDGRSDAPAAALPIAAHAPGAEGGGDASRILIAGTPIAANAPALPVAVEVGAGLVALGGLLLVLKLGLGALYTRLEASNLLSNPNRRLLFSAIQRSPGAHRAQLQRETGMSEVVLRHHLRQLVAHRLVVERAAGKLRTYEPADAATPAALVPAVDALRDPTRRRLAEHIALSGLRSQKEAGLALGIGQRLVSHHMAALEKAGLVEGQGSMPRRYAASPLLRDALARDPPLSSATA